MEPTLVSVIITTHNRRDLVQRAINSVYAQTYPNIELIVVDDHSDDGTSDVCKDPRIRYIYIPKDESRGGNYARNVGIKESRGEFCAFLDDDDYWLPTKIEKQVILIQKQECELVYCGKLKEIVKDDGIEYVESLPVPKLCGDMSKKILYAICTTTTNMLVMRQALLDVGMFDDNLEFWQEYELLIRLAQRKPFYYVNEPLSVYRIDVRDNSRLTNKYFSWRGAVRYIHRKHADLYRQLGLFEKYRVRNLIWRDAARRCKSSGLSGRYLLYRLLYFPYLIGGKLRK